MLKFKTLVDFNPNEIASLHRKIWNQGRVPLMFISSPHELRNYNCYKEPVEYAKDLESLEIDRFENAVDAFIRLEETYHQSNIDSGLFWESTTGRKINNSASHKVDKRLVANLKKPSIIQERFCLHNLK